MIVAQPSILASLSIVPSSSLQQAIPSLALLPLETLGEASRPAASRLSIFPGRRRNPHLFILLRALAALFPTSALCFQWLPRSFAKTPGVGVPSKPVPSIQQLTDFFPAPSCNSVTSPSHPAPLPLTTSRPTIEKLLPCFHYDTKPSSSNSFLFTSIQNPRGWQTAGPCRQLNAGTQPRPSRVTTHGSRVTGHESRPFAIMLISEGIHP
jgi:hypothetical protein